jgi:hypothetical protein
MTCWTNSGLGFGLSTMIIVGSSWPLAVGR